MLCFKFHQNRPINEEFHIFEGGEGGAPGRVGKVGNYPGEKHWVITRGKRSWGKYPKWGKKGKNLILANFHFISNIIQLIPVLILNMKD